MSVEAIVFYILSAFILTFGVLTVVSRRIFRAAIYLLLTLIGVAGVYIIMDMEFIAAIQIIVYVGGIVVLLIFSIFLTHQAGEKLPQKLFKRIAWGLFLSLTGFLLINYITLNHQFKSSSDQPIDNSIETIGKQLLDYKEHGYVFPFEVVSVLLLAALVGSIVIAMKVKKQ